MHTQLTPNGQEISGWWTLVACCSAAEIPVDQGCLEDPDLTGMLVGVKFTPWNLWVFSV